MLRRQRHVFGRQRDLGKSGARMLSAGVLVVSACGLLVASHSFPAEIADLRTRLAGPLDRLSSLLRAPLDPLRALAGRFGDQLVMESELKRLRAENEELKGWQWRAQELERQVSDLSQLTRVVGEPALKFVTSRVRVRGLRPFSHSVLVNVGRRHGLEAGLPVVNGAGLVGFVYEVGEVAARVRFLIDPATRVTVRIGRSGALAVAAGRGGAALEITELERRFDVAEGDEVQTAGEIGGTPGGLKVGTVVKTSRGLAIRPSVEADRAEFVSVLLPKLPAEPDGFAAAGEALPVKPADAPAGAAAVLVPAVDVGAAAAPGGRR